MGQKKLESLEGVRAVACLGIVLCHLWGGFFPQSVFFASLMSTPLFYFFSGNTAVRIMFVLSGFVLSYKYFSTGKSSSLQRDTIKRYFRLALPAAAVTFLVYLIMKGNLLYNKQAGILAGTEEFLGIFNQFEPNLITCLKEGFFGVIFRGQNSYVGPLWTMTVEMLGSLLVLAAVALLTGKRVRYVFYILYLLLFPEYYNYFILGMAISDLYVHEAWLNRFLKEHRILTVALHIGCWCYIGMVSNLNVFRWKELLFLIVVTFMFLTLLNSQLLDKIWGNKVAAAVGKQSFSIYLLHWPVIQSVSCFYFIYMTERGMGRDLILVTDILLTYAVVWVLSLLFTRFVVQPSAKLSEKATDLILGG